MPLNRIRFMNTYIDNITLNEAISHIEQCIAKRKISQVTTPNVDQIVRIENDKYFQTICENSELLIVDGHPLLWIARFYKKPFKQKICGSDLVPILCELAAQRGYSVFFLGAAPGVAECAANKMVEKYSKLAIAGTYSPPIGFEKDREELNKINVMLKNSNADILFVGMGAPKQEIFIYENMNIYQIPVSLAIGAGIDFIAGKQKRAPEWMRNIGFEWLYRLYREPKRMFRRYIMNDLKIIKLVIKYRKESSGS